MKTITNNYSFYKIVDGRYQWHFEPLHITELVAEVESLQCMLDIKRKDITVLLLAGDDPATVERRYKSLHKLASYGRDLMRANKALAEAVEAWHETIKD